VNHTYYSEGILLYEAGKIKEIRILVERVTVINTSVFKVFGRMRTIHCPRHT
jgi:hypothetical protein